MLLAVVFAVWEDVSTVEAVGPGAKISSVNGHFSASVSSYRLSALPAMDSRIEKTYNIMPFVANMVAVVVIIAIGFMALRSHGGYVYMRDWLGCCNAGEDKQDAHGGHPPSESYYKISQSEGLNFYMYLQYALL